MVLQVLHSVAGGARPAGMGDDTMTTKALIHQPGAHGHTYIATVETTGETTPAGEKHDVVEKLHEDVNEDALGNYVEGILHDLQESEARIGFTPSPRGADRVYEITGDQIARLTEPMTNDEDDAETEDDDTGTLDTGSSALYGEYGSSPEGLEQMKREMPRHLR